MSLESLRHVRLGGSRPWLVRLIIGECPHPDWPWYHNDPSLVWSPEGRDLRALDLRPLVHLPVVALVPSIDKHRAMVTLALADAGARFAGIAERERAEVTEHHPWAERMRRLAGEDDWQRLIEPVLLCDWDVYVGGGHGIAL